MEKDVPKEMDWVEHRSKCSVENLFMLLYERVVSDTALVNKDLQGSGEHFECHRIAAKKFLVSKYAVMGANSKPHNVVFECANAGIAVSIGGADGVALFTAKPSFDASGDCLLEIDGEPKRLWQVSRAALEDLFFS